MFLVTNENMGLCLYMVNMLHIRMIMNKCPVFRLSIILFIRMYSLYLKHSSTKPNFRYIWAIGERPYGPYNYWHFAAVIQQDVCNEMKVNTFVVYFDQRTGAPHAVPWSK